MISNGDENHVAQSSIEDLTKTARYFQVLKGNQEAKAWCYIAAAQGVHIAAAVLTSPPLLKLAENAAQCPESVEECSGRVYGFRPSSLLTAMQTASGFIIAILLPVIGSMVDSTSYRRGFMIATAVILVISNYIISIISEDTWLFCAILITFNAVMYFIQNMLAYAYIPELTEDTEELTILNSIYMVLRSISLLPTILIIGIIVYLTYGLGLNEENEQDDDVTDQNLSREIGFARCATLFQASSTGILYFMTFYKGLKPRAKKKKAAKSLTEAIFTLKDTAVEIYKKYPALFWYLMAILPLANSAAALAPIAVTFLTSFLERDTLDVVIFLFIFAFCSVLGSRFHPLISRRVNLLNDIKINMVFWIILSIITGLTITSPEHHNLFAVLTCFWSFVFGWVIPCMRTLYMCLMPKGREGQFIGIYMFFSNGFIWVLPLLVTALNEAGMPMNQMFFVFMIPFVFALLLLMKVGKFEDAVAHVKEQERLDEEEASKP